MAKETAVLEASAAKVATFNTASVELAAPGEVAVFVDVTVVTGGSPTLDVTVEWSHDGTAWFTLDGGVETFTQITAAAKVVKRLVPAGRHVRAACAIAGTTPSFTMSVTAVKDSVHD